MSRNGWGTAARAMVCVDGVLTLVFGVSAVTDAATPPANRVLEATFGAGMGLFAIALGLIAFGGRRDPDPRAWWVLWFLPVFFALHVAFLGTWLPDAVLCALTVAALVAGRPARTGLTTPPAAVSHAAG